MFPRLTFSSLVSSRNYFFVLFIFALWCPHALAQQDNPKNSAEITTLEVGKPVQRELAGLEEHHYQVLLTEQQYAHAVITQRGVDVVVQLVGPDGKLILEFDNESRTEGEEKIDMVTTFAGNYQLLVKAKYPKLAAGRYEIRLIEARAATENERLLDEARLLVASALHLMSVAQMKEAFTTAKKALALQEQVLGPEHEDLANTLSILGGINRFLVDFQSAEAFYLRGLRIAEKTLYSDHPLIARLLYNLGYNYSQKGEY